MSIRTALFSNVAIAALAFVVGVPAASAGNVPIVNPSFEQPALGAGAASNTIPGWILNSATGGVFHPATSPQPTDGVQVAYANPVESNGFPPGASLQQLLTTTVTPNMLYVLRADFIAGDAPYQAVLGADTDALVVGGQRLGASDFLNIAAHQTKTITVTFRVLPGDPAIGHHIAIFANTFFSSFPAGTRPPVAYFDNFRLDASPGFIPPPVLHGAFGLHGFVSPETARLKAYCDGSVAPTPCDVTLEFEDLRGSVLAQSTQTLQPGTSGFFDLPSTRAAGGPSETIPGFIISRGSAIVSFELLDSLTQRTQILADWGDGTRARTGDVDFGLAGLTPFDTGRLGAFCPVDSSAPEPCNVVFEFHDSQGRLLKQSRSTLQPGTGDFLDLQYLDTSAVGGRTEVLPLIRVTGGAAIGTFAVMDRSTGRTLAEAYPGRAAAPLDQRDDQ